MAFLSKTENKADIEKIDELMGKPIKPELKELLTSQGAKNLRKLLKTMAKEGKTAQELEYFFNYTLSKTQYIQTRKQNTSLKLNCQIRSTKHMSMMGSPE